MKEGWLADGERKDGKLTGASLFFTVSFTFDVGGSCCIGLLLKEMPCRPQSFRAVRWRLEGLSSVFDVGGWVD